MARTWTEKLHNGQQPQVKRTNRVVRGFPIGTPMLIPSPEQVDAGIRSIPRGEERTLSQIGADLAQQSGAALTCPLCCGMFARIAAEAAYEEIASGAEIASVTPFWRVARGPSKPKIGAIPPEFVQSQRKSEGLDA